MGDSDFRPPGALKPLNQSSRNLAQSITSCTPTHTPKLFYTALGVLGGRRRENVTLYTFLFKATTINHGKSLMGKFRVYFAELMLNVVFNCFQQNSASHNSCRVLTSETTVNEDVNEISLSSIDFYTDINTRTCSSKKQ